LVHAFLQRFPFGRAAFGLLLLLSLNAACRNASFASEPPGLRENLKTHRFLYAFPESPASHEQGRALACVNKRCQTTNPKTAQRSKAERECWGVGEQMDRRKNFMACLHGPANGGAEKRKGS
jgi:hypothetical protein